MYGKGIAPSGVWSVRMRRIGLLVLGSRTGPGSLHYWTVTRRRSLALATRPKYRASDVAIKSIRSWLAHVIVKCIDGPALPTGTLRWKRGAVNDVSPAVVPPNHDATRQKGGGWIWASSFLSHAQTIATRFLPRLPKTKPPTQGLQIHGALSSHSWEYAYVTSSAITQL